MANAEIIKLKAGMTGDFPIVNKAEEYVRELFDKELSHELLYHNLLHTVETVRVSYKLAMKNNLSKHDLEVLLIAAWFHDTGYLKKYKGHEDESKLFAENFLNREGIERKKVNEVLSCIEATRNPRNPETLTEKILCDADVSHLWKKSYFEKCESLRIELSHFLGQIFTQTEWLNREIDFLKQHRFYTEYARKKFQLRKDDHISKLQQKLIRAIQKNEQVKEKFTRRKELNNPARGIQTMFRTTFRNHVNLSSIADSKANFMLTINAIIISISVSAIIPNFSDNPRLIIPTLLIVITSLATIVFAILSTRPAVTQLKFNEKDLEQKKSNLLFFGNFVKMEETDYERGMREMMKDEEFLYGSMTRDLYHLGIILDRKYKYLRISYNIFMIGLVASVLSFLAIFLLNV